MTIEELNTVVETGDIDEFIRVCEARQVKALSKIADTVSSRGGVRLVQLAGASSAGKTTTAKRLATQLRVNGVESIHLSTDDYFVGEELNPVGPDGEPDYETIECVDMKRLAADVNGLLAGESVRLRRFDFVKKSGYDAGAATNLPDGGVVVLEGIHALNPRLTAEVPDACKFKIFIEPKTQPEVFGPTRLPSADARLLRRLVRDNRFRRLNPSATFRMWPNVLAGEEKWINPFRHLADKEFDSYLCYEVAVLKFYAGGLVAKAQRELGDTTDILNMIRLLEPVSPVSSDIVPGNSILRETIGSSQLDY